MAAPKQSWNAARSEGWSVRVRFMSPFPYTVLRGGLEVQAEETLLALRRRGMDAEFLDPGPRGDAFDLLHAFGPGIGISEVVPHLEPKIGLVVSLLSGSPEYSLAKTAAKRLVTSISRLAGQRTDFALRRAVLSRADRIIVLTTLERDYAVRTYGIPSGKFVVVPNGVSMRFFEATAALFHERFPVEDFALFVGSIVPRKNPLNLARVLARRGLPGVFIGPMMPAFGKYGREFADFMAQVPQLTWIAGVAHADPLLASAYAASRLVCLPSSAETQPLAALEGLAAGKPLVLGDSPYARQPPFENCMRCDPLNPASIERAVEEVLRRDDSVQPLSVLTWDEVAALLDAVYQDIVA